MEKGVARTNPAQRWQDRYGPEPNLGFRVRQVDPNWNNAISADKTVDLRPERKECDEVNQPERTEKPAACPKISWWPDIFSPKQSCHRRGERPIFGDDAVGQFRSWGETGNVLVTPPQPSFRATAA